MWRLIVFVALCSKLFHVRPVTQGDVYRAETEEIPRIFQVGASFLFSLDFKILIQLCQPFLLISKCPIFRQDISAEPQMCILSQCFWQSAPPLCLYSDFVCQRGGVQEGGRNGDGPSGRQDQLSTTQRPRVHPHVISLPFQLWGLLQTSVACLQATSGPWVSPLPRQVPQGPPWQKGGCYCSLQR